MKKKKRIAILTILFCLFCFTLSGAAAEEKKAGLTIMVYMCGSDLESSYASATQDIREMLKSGAGGPEVSILVMLGGSRQWSDGYEADRLTMIEIRGGKRRIAAEAAPRSMGSPDTLQYLISHAKQKYPAEEYALIFWDHGSGPMEGLCFDEIYKPDRLSVEEITEVLAASGFSEKKLKWIGFDACLMGSVEVAAQLAPYAEYMIASEETEPSFGWNYLFLEGIEKDRSMEETAKRLIDLYVGQETEDVMTLSCLDLAKVSALTQAADETFRHAAGIADPAHYSEIARLRKMILSYGADVSRGMLDHDLVDMDQLINSIPGLDEETVRSFTQATKEAVVYRNSNIHADSGISVYFPFYNKRMYDEWIRRYPAAGAGAAYLEYIRQFGAMLTDPPFADWSRLDMKIYLADRKKSIPAGVSLEAQTSLGVVQAGDSAYIESLTPEEAAAESGILVRTELSAEQQRDFLSARLLVMERFHTMLSEKSRYRVVYSSPELEMSDDGAVRAVYPELTLHIVDENGTSLASEVSYSYRENGDLAVRVIARESFSGEAGRELPMILTFRQDGDGRLAPAETYLYDELTGNYTNRAGYNPEEYPYLIFPYQYTVPVSDGNGERLNYVEWEESRAYNRETVIANDGTWHPEFRDASGNYALAMCLEIADTQNNRHITTLRTVDWGYGSRDMIYENPNLRVIAENLREDGEQVSLNMTLISSEMTDFELAVCNASVNGESASVKAESGKPVPVSERFHLQAGEAFTRTVSFVKNSGEPLSELAFRLAVFYDDSIDLDAGYLENDTFYGYLNPGDEEPDSGPDGPRWSFSEKIVIRVPARQEAHGSVYATDEMTVQGGNICFGNPVHWADAGSASPLKAELSGETRFSRAEISLEGKDLRLYLGEVRRDGGEYVMEVRQAGSALPGSGQTLSFLISEKNMLLRCGADAFPVTLETDGEKAVLKDLQIPGEAENAGPHVIDAEIGENRIRRVLWQIGDEPAELARKMRWNTLEVRWTEGGKASVRQILREENMESPLITLQAEEHPVTDDTVLITGRDGTVLMTCAAAELSGHKLPGDQDPDTTVIREDPKTGIRTAYSQTDEWIWTAGPKGARVIRYIGNSPDAVLPERLGGMTLSGLEDGCLSQTRAYNVSLPHLDMDITIDTFSKYIDSKLRTSPDKGTLTVRERWNVPADIRESIHREAGFARFDPQTAESFWEPPLICLRTGENELEIIGFSGWDESIEIPETVNGMPVTAIGDGAFRSESLTAALREIVIPEGIRKIGSAAFKNSKIREITLPASLEEISTDALDSCNQLRKVHIRCSLDRIEKDLFAKCVLLRHDPYGITLPDDATDEEIETFMKRVFPELDRPLRRENEQEGKP